jgi:hypothetical protein
VKAEHYDVKDNFSVEPEHVQKTLFIHGLMHYGLAYTWKIYCGNPAA